MARVSPMQSTTLEYFVHDYVDHLKHHLAPALPQDAWRPKACATSGRALERLWLV